MLKVLGSLTSPFVRTVRTTCEELGLEYELVQTSFFAKMNAQDEATIQKHNPVMRVPVLVDGDQGILDSRIICRYLIEKSGNNNTFQSSFEEKIREENAVSMIHGAIDAGVLRFILALENADLNSGYLARSYKRMESCLEALNAEKQLGQNFGLAEMMLVCALEWFKKRSVIDWSGYDHLLSVYNRHKDRPSLVVTRIPETA